jgi:2-oxoglutarate dehydrogenase E1 component
VLWEAQFGDFANGAQIIIDQFVCAGEDKWNLLSGLVMLLPHGNEGQGPEHTSARPERFLQLAAQDNIQVAQPSTSGNYFHLLRRQALRTWRKPLIVMTPKSMLRAEPACSNVDELANGSFQPVIEDREARDVRGVILCTERSRTSCGRTCDARGHGPCHRHARAALPFPADALKQALSRYPADVKVTWVQEEPANMGALSFVRPRIGNCWAATSPV